MFFADVFYSNGQFDHLFFSEIEVIKDFVSCYEKDEKIGCIKVFDGTGLKVYETNAIDWLV